MFYSSSLYLGFQLELFSPEGRYFTNKSLGLQLFYSFTFGFYRCPLAGFFFWRVFLVFRQHFLCFFSPACELPSGMAFPLLVFFATFEFEFLSSISALTIRSVFLSVLTLSSTCCWSKIVSSLTRFELWGWEFSSLSC